MVFAMNRFSCLHLAIHLIYFLDVPAAVHNGFNLILEDIIF